MNDALIEAVATAVADSDRMQIEPKVYEPRYIRYARAALAAIEAAGFEVVKRDRADGPGSGLSDIDGAIASNICGDA